MRSTLKFLLALAVALVSMLAFRALVFTVFTVEGGGLEPTYLTGDRLLVNRWAYGLRVGDGRFFPYDRLGRSNVERGDIIVFEDPRDSLCSRILVCRCRAVPGDEVVLRGEKQVVPGLNSCADADYYYMETLNPENREDSQDFGLVPDRCIIGSPLLVVYNPLIRKRYLLQP
jgi:signal peptidase I